MANGGALRRRRTRWRNRSVIRKLEAAVQLGHEFSTGARIGRQYHRIIALVAVGGVDLPSVYTLGKTFNGLVIPDGCAQGL